MDQHVCLTELIDQDLTANEYYQTLPESIRQQLRDVEITSFEELQKYVTQIEMQERTETSDI